MTDISRSLQDNSTSQKNTQIDADYLDRQEQGKKIDLKQKVGDVSSALGFFPKHVHVNAYM